MTHQGILIGYARTSTSDQMAGLTAQVRDLTAAGCGKVFQEQVSSVVERAQLDAALEYARQEDTLGLQA
jgi:DNA invertase Pin-like site-specific DNA recombinase